MLEGETVAGGDFLMEFLLSPRVPSVVVVVVVDVANTRKKRTWREEQEAKTFDE